MLGLIGKKELQANSMFTTARKLRDLYHYDVMGGRGRGKGKHYIENLHAVFVLSCLKFT